MNVGNIYYFYSQFSERSLHYLNLVDALGGECVCVDSDKVKKRLSKLKIDQIPSLIEIKPNSLLILQGQNAVDFIKKYFKEEKTELKFHQTNPVQRIVEKQNTSPPPRTMLKFNENNTMLTDETQEKVKKAVKEFSIMDKVKLLTKEREADLVVDKQMVT